MSTLLSIDPGIRGAGAALWRGGLLVRAAYVRGTPSGSGPDAWRALAAGVTAWVGTPPDEVVCEIPQIYTQVKLKGDPEDLLQLVGVDGAIVQAFSAARATVVRPHAWKGSVPKEVMIPRILKRLSVTEAASIEFVCVSLRHNVHDAIGVGLHHLGRL